MMGSAYAQSNLPACPSSGYFHNCFGTLTYASGNKYVGEFKDDKRNGQGTFTFADGEKYVGEFKDDKRNGQGTYTYADGEKYVGELKDDKRNGQGIFYLANGSISQSGDWRDNSLVTSQHVDPNSFTRIAKGNSAPSAVEAQQSKLPACPSSGYFHNCFGTYTYFNQGKYVGEFKDDKRNGEGTFTYASGEKYVGLYRDNQPHGYGIIYSSSGSIIHQGRWDKGVLVLTVAVDTQRFPFNHSSIQSVPLSPTVDELERQREVRERQRQAKERADRERPAREAAQREFEAQTQRILKLKQIQQKQGCENLVQTCVTQLFRGYPLLEKIANKLYIHPNSIQLDRTSKSTCSCTAVFYTPKGTTTCEARSKLIDSTYVQCQTPDGNFFETNLDL